METLMPALAFPKASLPSMKLKIMHSSKILLQMQNKRLYGIAHLLVPRMWRGTILKAAEISTALADSAECQRSE